MAHGLDEGCRPGGILELLELIEEHPAALAFDLRARLGISIDDLGGTVSWREAVLVVSILLRDPSSWTAAAKQGWSYPVSREWLVGAHTYDLLAAVNTKKGSKPKRYPSPFPDKAATRFGRTTRSSEEVRKILAWMNPKKESNG